MSATLVSATGSWGLASQETSLGVIIESIDQDTRSEFKPQKNNVGERVGGVFYDDSVEVKVKGSLMATNGYAGKLAANLTLANAISASHLMAANSGRLLTKGVKRTYSNEDWAGVEIDAEAFPFFT